MATVKVSADGKEFFDIPDSDVGEALEKGYTPYYDVSADGAEYHTIPGDDLQEATAKGYKTKSVWDAESSQMSGAGRATVDATLTGVEKVGKAFDYLTGAPARAAVYEVVKPGDEGYFRRGVNAVKAGLGQYLKSPASAPTEKDIGASLGFSTDESIKIPLPYYTTKGGFQVDDLSMSPAGIVGGGLSNIADPTNLVGLGAAPKVGMAATKSAAKTGAKAVSSTAKVIDSIPAVKNLVKKLPGDAISSLGKAEQVVEAITETPLFRSKVSPEFPELARIAREADIPVSDLPASVEFGPKSIVTQLQKANMDSPLGESMRNAFEGVVTKTRDAVDKLHEEIGGGLRFDAQDAGDIVRNGYRDYIKREMADQENSYSAIAKRIGDTPADGSDALQTIAQKWRDKVRSEQLENVRDPETGRIVQQVNSRGQSILDNIDGALQSRNLDDLHRQIKIVGNQAFGDPITFNAPIDQRAMRELYGDLREAFTSTVEKVDPKQAAALKEHNKRMTSVLGQREMFEKIIENVDKDPSQVLKFVTSNTNRIDEMKKVLSPGQFQAVKAAVVDQVIKRNADGAIMFGSTRNSIDKNRAVLSAVLDAEELRRFEELNKLGYKMGADTLNPSGTAKELQYIELAKAPVRSILANQTMQRIGDRLADSGRAEAVAKGMRVDGSKFPVGTPDGFTSTLGDAIPTSPVNPFSQFNKDLTLGERALDIAGKGRLYSKHQYQEKQEQINESERDEDHATKISRLVSTNPALLGKYGPTLNAAIQRGGNSFAATHFMLQQRDPEYRELLKRIEEGGH